MQFRDRIIQLSLIDGVGAVTVKRLLHSLTLYELSALTDFTPQQLAQKVEWPVEKAQSLLQALGSCAAYEQEIQAAQRRSIRILTVLDDDYPAALKMIHAPPPVLYIKGSWTYPLERSVALVGSRQVDAYGRTVLEQFVPCLVNEGFGIVSGGALGADTIAHEQTLKHKGQTLAVIGSGLLKPYPSTNQKLFEQIIERGGAVMSPFALQVAAQPHNFPARNRIIAGLSYGTIVIQAAQKSGALITAAYAREEGREVAAVPGAITNPLSAGCHSLIKEGATLLSNEQELLEFVGIQRQQTMIKPVKQVQNAQKPVDPLVNLCAQPQDFDELLLQSGLDFIGLQQKLSQLQVEGILTQDISGRWHVAG